MEVVSSSLCPHGLPKSTCQICRVLDPSSLPDSRSGKPERRAGFPGGLATVAVVAIVGFLVVSWVSAAVWAVLRILLLVAVAAVAGWIGWKLGIHQGRRQR